MEIKPFLTLKLEGWELTEEQLKRLETVDGQPVNIRYTGESALKMDFGIPKDKIITSLEEQLINANGGLIMAEIYY